MICVHLNTIECIYTNLGCIAYCSARFIPLDCFGLLCHNTHAGFVLASNFTLQTAYLEFPTVFNNLHIKALVHSIFTSCNE